MPRRRQRSTFAQPAPLISVWLLRSLRRYNVRSFLRLDIAGEHQLSSV